MKAALYTLGCKVNQYETQTMSEALKASGYEIVSPAQDADIYVVNSCTVTAQSDHKTRQAVRRFKRSHPTSCVVLTGCMPQSYPVESLELMEADVILGNANNNKLLQALEEYLVSHRRIIDIQQHQKGEKFTATQISSFDERTRAFVKIQDGCDRFCSYCIIPLARGRVRSRPLDEIRQELERLAAAGYLEVVLVGINLSAYGKDTGDTICDAVSVACSVEGIQRVRLGSLEPDHMTEEVIQRLSREEKLCPQFHISLQSGCNQTLKRMNRHYTSAEYRALCDQLRMYFSGCSLTTDVMVGFAQESEADFQESLDFVREVGFAKAHIFPYSRREGTRAAEFPGQLSNAVKGERAKRMAEAAEQSRMEFLSSQVGLKTSVLFETEVSENIFEGYTPNYTPVRVKSDNNLSHQLVNVILTCVEEDYMIGTLTEE